jgi:hypothetical protein
VYIIATHSRNAASTQYIPARQSAFMPRDRRIDAGPH